MVIQFGVAESRLLRLLRFAGSGSRTEQFHLSPIGVEQRLNLFQASSISERIRCSSSRNRLR